MTNSERYRKAFEKIHAPENRLEQVAGAASAPVRRRHRGLHIAATVAAVLILLVGTVSAELADGAISNLLAPLYGGAQSEIVDHIGYPVGASVTVNGYTLTADATIGDKYNIAVVYTLTRDDGEPLPQGAFGFEEWESNACDLSIFGGGAGSVTFSVDKEQGDRLRIVQQWSSTSPLLLHNLVARAKNLAVYNGDPENYQIVAEGEWVLSFTLRYQDATVSIPVDDLKVTGTEGKEYVIQALELSPVGLHMDLLAPNDMPGPEDDTHEEWLMLDFRGVFLRLSDGTMVDLDRYGSRGGGGSQDDPMLKAHYDSFFEFPISLAEVEAVVICGTEVPVKTGN